MWLRACNLAAGADYLFVQNPLCIPRRSLRLAVSLPETLLLFLLASRVAPGGSFEDAKD